MHDALPDDPGTPSACTWPGSWADPGGALGKTRPASLPQQGKAIRCSTRTPATTGPATTASPPAILKIVDPAARLKCIRQACRRSFCGQTAPCVEVADNARDVDFALRWGFGWAGGLRAVAGGRLGRTARSHRRRHRGRPGDEPGAAAGLVTAIGRQRRVHGGRFLVGQSPVLRPALDACRSMTASSSGFVARQAGARPGGTVVRKRRRAPVVPAGGGCRHRHRFLQVENAPSATRWWIACWRALSAPGRAGRPGDLA